MTTVVSPSGTAALFADLSVRVETDAPLAAHTWFGIGGRADVLVHPRDEASLAMMLRRCHQSGIPVRVLGSGANLLVSDEGVDGVVVKLDEPAFREVKSNASGTLEALRAGAGADLARLVNDCARRGLEGLSPMAGVPASIGGAVRMNAGGRFGAIGDVVHAVALLSLDGSLNVFPAAEIRFGYRETSLPAGVILWSSFSLREDDPLAVRERVKEIFAHKKSTQPLADHSAGCVFRNPMVPSGDRPNGAPGTAPSAERAPGARGERESAGRLIDLAGLKGHSIGGARVSDRHGNFITVSPGTRTADVEALIQLIRDRVREASGVTLDTEVVIWRRGEA